MPSENGPKSITNTSARRHQCNGQSHHSWPDQRSHSCADALFRGIADDLDLQEWLTKYIFPAEAKNVTEDFVRAGTRLGFAEMIRGGTTTYCDMYYFEDAIADET